MADVADMDIGDAVAAMRDGKKVSRRDWVGLWMAMGHGGGQGVDHLRLYEIAGPPEGLLASSMDQFDVLGQDWYVVE